MIVTIENNGPALVASNFWQSEHALRGLFYLSTNAGAFRLLVPEVHSLTIAEFRTAKDVILSRGPWKAQDGRDAIEILFDDGTDSPFSLHLDAKQLDRLPSKEDTGRELLFTAWLKGPTKAFEHACYYRIVPEIPWLKPFNPEDDEF